MNNEVIYISTCHVDETGRMVLPAKIRKELDIKPYEDFKITATKDSVTIEAKKYE